MRAVTYHRYGDPSVLTVEEVPEPHAGPGRIRIPRSTPIAQRYWDIYPKRDGAEHPDAAA